MASRALVTMKASAEPNRTPKILPRSQPSLSKDRTVPIARSQPFNFSDIRIFSRDEDSESQSNHKLLWPLQAKLEIGGVDEPLEREADQRADRVLRMPGPTETTSLSGGEILRRKCQSCSEEEKKDEDEIRGKLSRKESGRPSALDGRSAPPIVHDALKSPGQPLDVSTRDFFEPRFGHDFSKVRVHTDARAEESAGAVKARAYTVGNDIVFGPGQHRPRSSSGQRLLAHELAHVAQGTPPAPMLFRSALTYDPTAFTIPPPHQPFTLDDAKQLVENKKTATPPELKSGAVKGATPGSTEEIFLWYILAEVAEPKRWNTEVDMVTVIGWAPAAGGSAPVGKVTVDIDADGNGVAELISAGPVTGPSTYTKKEDAVAELQSKYGIKSVKDDDSTWSIPQLNEMVGAFALLPAKDRVALNGVDLLRVAQIDGGKNCGEFGSSQSVADTTVTAEATLKIADCAFGHEDKSFVGGKATQSPEGYMTIVHEVGHAIATKASRDAGVAHMEAIAKSNEAIEESNTAIGAANSLIDEFNALVKEHNDLVAQLNDARKGTDKDAIKTASDALADKKKELAAKKKEVDAAKKEQDNKKKAADAAKKTVETKKKAEEASFARVDSFKAGATANKANAAAKLAAAKAAAAKFTQADADESAAYRSAVDDAATAIAGYVTSAAEEGADLDSLDSTVQDAIDSRNSAREALSTANSSNAALGKFEAVDKAQDGWFDTEKALAHARHRSAREQKFVDFVNAHNIKPFTQYAKDNWPLKPGEFYAEAYSLWRTDPEYLKKNFKALFDWFEAGSYK
jgi:hypothetical protein